MKSSLHLEDLARPELWAELSEQIHGSRAEDVTRALAVEQRGVVELAALLSPAAAPMLEELAARARSVTERRFGRTVVLYVPLYLSNACLNHCSYCGFASDRSYRRRTLTGDEIDAEAARLRAEGFQHVLLLTGEDPREVPLAYLREAVRRCHGRFGSVGIEVYPLDQDGYAELVAAGCDSLTLYQETYHQPTYRQVHPAGPKARFEQRLSAPSQAAAAGMRSVGLGALLGLTDWRVEGMFLALHGAILRQRFWRSRLSIGFPRLRDDPGAGVALQPMSEAELAQMICALRLVFPDADLVLSTRERQAFRDGMVGLGVTRMSAGSKTRPGGYALDDATTDAAAGEQFAITDGRSPTEVAAMLEARGYEPVWKDFDQGFLA